MNRSDAQVYMEKVAESHPDLLARQAGTWDYVYRPDEGIEILRYYHNESGARSQREMQGTYGGYGLWDREGGEMGREALESFDRRLSRPVLPRYPGLDMKLKGEAEEGLPNP